MSLNLRKLREERAKLATQARGMLDAAEKEGRGFSAEERTTWEKLSNDIRDLGTRIRNAEEIGDVEAELLASTGTRSVEPTEGGQEQRGNVDPQVEERTALESAFNTFLRRGMAGLRPEQRERLEKRAQSVGTDAEGGYLVPEGFGDRIIEKLAKFGGMRQSGASILTTSSGNNIPYPTVDETAQEGAIINENTAASEQDVAFGVSTLEAFLYSSKMIRVPFVLLQDSAFDLNAFLERVLVNRLGRVQNKHFTIGTGSGQPRGVVTAASVGKTGAAGQTSTIIYNDLVDLKHSVPAAYRELGAKWMFSDAMLGVISKLVDSDGRPLWIPSLASSAPDQILGHGIIVNDHVAAPAASAKSIAFGWFGAYTIRDVRGVLMQRLSERYAEYGQVAFLGWARADGDLMDAGGGAVKVYQHPAA